MYQTIMTYTLNISQLCQLYLNKAVVGGVHERRHYPSESSNKTDGWGKKYTHTHTYRWIWGSLTFSAWALRGPKTIGLERLICSTHPPWQKGQLLLAHLQSWGTPTFYTDQLISVLLWWKKILFKNSAFMIVTKITVIISVWWDPE